MRGYRVIIPSVVVAVDPISQRRRLRKSLGWRFGALRYRLHDLKRSWFVRLKGEPMLLLLLLLLGKTESCLLLKVL